MSKAKKGDVVKVHYTGRLDEKTIFDTSDDRDPLEFKIGEGNLIAGFENAVKGLKVGEKVTISIPQEEAYGPYRKELVQDVEKTQFPENVVPEVGRQLQISQGDQQMVVTITGIKEDTITLDANHPLAGKELIFDLELIEIV
ncbi:MAG: peptidylprolyl isomerase [bacterium]|nr:peptidylprolyl isomerase [bacterium]